MSDNLQAHLLRKKSKAMDAFITEFETLIDGYDCGDGDYINDQWYKLKTQHLGNDKKAVMYLFTVNGHFEMLLEMSLENAEIQVVHLMIAHGYVPCYRWVQLDNRTEPHTIHSIEYGYTTGFDQMIKLARLEIKRPSTSLDNPWDNLEKRQRYPEWNKFMAEAHASTEHYYQWPTTGGDACDKAAHREGQEETAPEEIISKWMELP